MSEDQSPFNSHKLSINAGAGFNSASPFNDMRSMRTTAAGINPGQSTTDFEKIGSF